MKRSIAYMMTLIMIIGGLLLQDISTLYASSTTVFYIDPVAGDDSNTGESLDEAVKTIERARDIIRERANDIDIQVFLRGGIYKVEDTIYFNREDGTTGDNKITYQAYNNELPVISGGKVITGWSLYDSQENIYVANVEDTDFRQIYVNGELGIRARTPNRVDDSTFGPYLRVSSGDTNTMTLKVPLSDVEDYESWGSLSDVEMVFQTHWYHNSLLLHSIDEGSSNATIHFQDTYARKAAFGKPKSYYSNNAYHWENSMAFLDTAGEWYVNKTSKQLFYKAEEDDDMTDAEVIVPRVDTLIHIEGNPGQPVEGLAFEGLTFAYTNWNRPSEIGTCLTQCAQARENEYSDTEALPAAVRIDYGSNLEFYRNRFINLGANGLQFYKGVTDSLIKGNVFKNIAANGINIDGKTRQNPDDEQLTLLSKQVDGSHARVDYIELDNGAGIQRYEAEDLLIVGYEVEESTVYSNGKGIKLPAGKSGRVYLDFLREDENIHVTVGYISEGDGDATYRIDINDEPSKEWTAQPAIGSNVLNSISYTDIVVGDSDLDLCERNTISNNYITLIGQVYSNGAGILSSYARDLDVLHNEISYGPYMGVQVGNFASGSLHNGTENMYIANNYIHHMVQLHDDGGGIYTTGPMEGTVFEENLITDIASGPWALNFGTSGIFLDGESDHILVQNNVLRNLERDVKKSSKAKDDITVVNNSSSNSSVEAAAGLEEEYEDIKIDPTPPGPVVLTGEFYVDPISGNDANNGQTEETAFETVKAARDFIRAHRDELDEDVTVYLREGKHSVTEPLEFTHLDSGTDEQSITYRNYPNETPVLSGGQEITGWEDPDGDGIYEATLTGQHRYLYMDDEKITMARWPNVDLYDFDAADWHVALDFVDHAGVATGKLKGDGIKINEAELPEQPIGAEVVMKAQWFETRMIITDYSLDSQAGTAKVWTDQPGIIHRIKSTPPYYWQNSLEFLDIGGEYYIDNAQQKVYYKPLQHQDINTLNAYVGDVTTVLALDGVDHINFYGIRFEHTENLLPNSSDERGHNARVGGLKRIHHLADDGFYGKVYNGKTWEDSKGHIIWPESSAMITIKNSEDIQFERNVIRNSAANGMNVYEGTKDLRIAGNVFYEIGDTAILYGAQQEPLPQVGEANEGDYIANNYIARYGKHFMSGGAIMSFYPKELIVEHNEFADACGWAMNIGWVSVEDSILENNQIRFNEFRNVMRMSTDAGMIHTRTHAPYEWPSRYHTHIFENYIHDIPIDPYHKESGGSKETSTQSGIWPIGGSKRAIFYLDGTTAGIRVENNVLQNNGLIVREGQVLEIIPETFDPNYFINNHSTEQRIIDNAGIQDEYLDIKNYVDNGSIGGNEDPRQLTIDKSPQGTGSGFELKAHFMMDGDLEDQIQQMEGDVSGNLDYISSMPEKGQAIKLKGDGSYVDLSNYMNALSHVDNPTLTNRDQENITVFPQGAHPRTIAMWVKTSSSATQSAFGYGGYGHSAHETPGQKVEILVNKNQVAIDSGSHVYGIDNLSLGSGWHHIAVIYPEGAEHTDQWKIYIDGEEKTQLETFSGSKRAITTFNEFAVIGRKHKKKMQFESTTFNGSIDELRIYDRALEADEISQLAELPVVSGDLDENFDDNITGQEPVGWDVSTFGATTCIIANIPDETNKSLMIQQPEVASSSSTAKISFTPVNEGSISVRAKVLQDNAYVLPLKLHTTNDDVVSKVRFSGNGKVSYYSGSQWMDSDINYEVDTWHTFRIDFDVVGETYDFFFDDNLIVDNISLGSNLNAINAVSISFYKGIPGSAYFDDFFLE